MAGKIHEVPVDMARDLRPLTLGDCAHPGVDIKVDFQAVVRNLGESPHTYMIELAVVCSTCGTSFRFRAPHAISFRSPARNLAGTTLSAPMEPEV